MLFQILLEAIFEDGHVEEPETREIASFHHNFDQLENALTVPLYEEESFGHKF
jgi:hypothetical protein